MLVSINWWSGGEYQTGNSSSHAEGGGGTRVLLIPRFGFATSTNPIWDRAHSHACLKTSTKKRSVDAIPPSTQRQEIPDFREFIVNRERAPSDCGGSGNTGN